MQQRQNRRTFAQCRLWAFMGHSVGIRWAFKGQSGPNMGIQGKRGTRDGLRIEAHQTLGRAPQIPRPQPCGDVLVLAEEEGSTDESRRSAAEEDNSVQTRIHLEGQEGPEDPAGAERGQKLRKEIQKNMPAGR